MGYIASSFLSNGDGGFPEIPRPQLLVSTKFSHHSEKVSTFSPVVYEVSQVLCITGWSGVVTYDDTGVDAAGEVVEGCVTACR